MPRIPVDALQGVQNTDEKGRLTGGTSRPQAPDGLIVTVNASQLLPDTPTAALEVACKEAQAALARHFRVVAVLVDAP